jgi:glucosamine--fructose-6-phosphate aminotransferase (isomerizing)
MGSSLSAARPAAARLASRIPAVAAEAGELLHYGLDSLPPGALMVLVSQSGRSAETLAVGERWRSRGGARILAVTNDPGSPLATLADRCLPIVAGAEATVATKTFMTTFAVLDLLAQAIAPAAAASEGAAADHLREAAAAVDAIADRPDIATAAAEAMSACASISLVGRGPAMAAADYGALILKETVARPAEALPGGSFRHGPLEICGPDVGVVVLAQSGATRDLSIRLALETSALGSPTWLIGEGSGELPQGDERLRVHALPAVGEGYVPLTMSVPIQRLAADLARRHGRVPGQLLRSRKVTDIE